MLVEIEYLFLVIFCKMALGVVIWVEGYIFPEKYVGLVWYFYILNFDGVKFVDCEVYCKKISRVN